MTPRLFFIVLTAFLIGGLAALTLLPVGRQTVTTSGQPSIGGPFALTNQDGKRVTNENFRGKFMLVAFGYTYCPDICPAELQTMTNALDALGAKADAIVPVFITVDPQRDTVKQMADYVKNFSPRIVGLTGTEEEIRAAAKAYRAYYQKEAPASLERGGEYLVSHSTFIYLMDPAGRYVTHFTYGITAEEMAAKLNRYISG